MALRIRDKIILLNEAGFTGDINYLTGSDGDIGAMRESQKGCPNFKNLSNKLSDVMSSGNEGRFILAFAEKWRQDEDVFKKIEADLVKNPQIAEEIEKMALADPDGLIERLKKYTGGNMEAALGFPVAPAAAVVAQPQAPAPAARPSSQPNEAVSNEKERIDFLRQLVEMSDEDIKKFVKPDFVKGMAAAISKSAIDKGADPVSASSFANKIQTDDNLAQKISNNMMRNPGFIREMARKALDNSPANAMTQQVTKAHLNHLMANPELLTNDAYVKNTETLMQASKAGFMAGMMQNMMGSMRGKFEDSFSFLGAIFGGRNQVLLVGAGGFLSGLMVDKGALAANMADFQNAKAYGPRHMTPVVTAGVDGKYTRKVTENGVEREVMNGAMDIMADGKKMTVVPSMGQLAAKQQKGYVGPDGKYVEGNFLVSVVTSINRDTGGAEAVKHVMMTPKDFEDYRKKVEAAAAEKPNMSQKIYLVEEFKDENFKKFAAAQHIPGIITIDIRSGAVNDATWKPEDGPKSYPVPGSSAPLMRNLNEPPANAPNFTGQGNG